MVRLLKWLLFLITFLVIVFILGPKPSYPAFDAVLPEMDLTIEQLEDYVQQKEADLPNLRQGNESQLIWADSIRKTPYAVVYLHGFSASPEEGNPIHREFAKRYGCNLYMPLLAGHGIDDIESFKDLTPKDLIDSAKEALAIGQLLGEKVILMSCSTGGTLSTYLAAHHPDQVHTLILYSPNINLFSPNAKILKWPWGLQLARMVERGKYRSFALDEPANNYWTTQYRIEGVIALKHLIDATQTPATWEKITQPLFLGYYYKNEQEQDKVVSVKAMKKMFSKVATPENQKMEVAFAEAATHAITSEFQSKEIDHILEKTYTFAESIPGLSPLTNQQ
jgi:esterase/lipase